MHQIFALQIREADGTWRVAPKPYASLQGARAACTRLGQRGVLVRILRANLTWREIDE